MAGGVARQLTWYIGIGVVCTAIQAMLYVTLREWWSPQPANVAALLVTTLANTEAHRWITFAGSGKPQLRVHLQAAVPLLVSYLSTSLALTAVHALDAGPSRLLEASALVAVTALGGLARFVVLRSWVFRRSRGGRPAASRPRIGRRHRVSLEF